MTRARHLYLELDGANVFAALHLPAPDAAPTGVGVLIVPPWGWEEVASHRERLAWADHLAGRGHSALRIDLPGTGDSGGSWDDPGLADDWIASVEGAVRWLRADAGATRIVTIGLGLGGVLATEALTRGAPIDDLVLWGMPANGRAVVREVRAFGLLQARTYGVADTVRRSEGSIEASGFVLSGETASRLSRLDPAELPVGLAGRALVLSRDRLSGADALAAQLSAANLEAGSEVGDGWAAMCVHPERFTPPTTVFALVDRWMAEAEPPSPTTDAATSPVSRSWTDGVIGEEAVSVDVAGTPMFGVLSAPIHDRPRLCAVFLNAGAVRHIGPNRMWVDASRRWARERVAALRIDVEGIGESGGDPGRYRDVTEFYRADVRQQVGAFLEELDRRWPGVPRVLIGLCAGGYWAAQVAASDAAVRAAILVNAGALVWDPGLLHRRRTRGLRRMRRTEGRARVLAGGISLRRLFLLLQALTLTTGHGFLRALERAARRAAGRSRPDPFGELLAELQRAGTHVTIAFSGDEPLAEELEEDGVRARAAQLPNVEFVTLPGSDHTLRPAGAQRALHQVMDEVIRVAVDGASG